MKKRRYSIILVSTVAAFILPPPVEAQIGSDRENRTNLESRSYADANRDGWNDVWVAKYPKAERGTTSDSNGDGTPNFIAMMLDLDPFAKPVAPNPEDPRAAEKLEKRRKDSRRRNRLALAPFMNDGIRDADGNPVTRADLKTEALRKSRALGVRLEREQVERVARLATYLAGPGAHLTKDERKHLHDVVDGEPRFITSLSHHLAIDNGISELWPGGYTNTNLTGAGATVAMWDQGGVAETHEQFGASRVEYGDLLLTPDEHATAVATVIIGAGDPNDANLQDLDNNGDDGPYPFPNTQKNNARGMAFQANLRVYNTSGDLTEIRALAEESLAGTRDIVFSNHAYGTICGFQRFHSGIWKWYGDPTLGDGKTDYKHGFYLSDPCREIDKIVHTNQVFLPIWSAGNENRNYDLVDTPEPEDGGESSPVAHKVIQTGITYTVQNSPSRYPDWYTAAFVNSGADNNLVPEACSKNVLSVSGSNHTGSRGPTDDLRFKPDIVNYAAGADDLKVSALYTGTTGYRQFEGSSFAAASVTGGMALIRQQWLLRNGLSRPVVLASTWKGLAIATAGGAQYVYNYSIFRSEGQRPSAEDGYGHFDPLDAVFVIEEDFAGRSAGKSARIMEILLKEGYEARFNIRSSDPLYSREFRVAICWTDPEGPELPKSLNPRDPVLINDLDLRVIRPGASDLEPWRLTANSEDENNPGYRSLKPPDTGDNIRDNVEVVDGEYIPDPEEYTVSITRKPNTINSAPQLVSIIIVGDAEAITPPFRILNFSQADEINPDIYAITWMSIPGETYQIESSPDLQGWQALQNEISAIGDRTCAEIDMANMGTRQFIRVRRLD